MYVHLHEAAAEIPAWLGHANVSVRPVIDLADQVAFDSYEHPDSLDERIHLRSPADSFPHANQVTRRLDDDHVVPYVPGAKGQTGDHNAQPLGRTGHRAKTHAGYRVRQLGPGAPRSSPNRVGSGLISDDPIDQAVAQMTLELQLTGVARVPRELVPQ